MAGFGANVSFDKRQRRGGSHSTRPLYFALVKGRLWGKGDCRRQVDGTYGRSARSFGNAVCIQTVTLTAQQRKSYLLANKL